MRVLPKSRLPLLVSLLLIFGFLATTLTSHLVSVTLLRKGLTESILPLTGDNIYSEIQKDLISPILISSMMASDTFLRDWVLAGEPDIERISRFLSEIKTKYQTITAFFVSEHSGIYYHAEGILKQVSPEEPRDAWYYRVRNMNEPYELNVDPDMANSDAMTIFINHRVYDYQGNYIGATGCGLSVTTVYRLLNSYEERYQRHIFFVEPNGIITFTSDSQEIGTSIHEIEGLQHLAAKVLDGQNGSFSYERDGQTFLLHTRFVSELGWHLLVEQSLDKEMGLLRKTLITNLILCSVISLIILGAVNRVLSFYRQRLEHLATTDKLTGLHNRHSGEALFQQALRETSRRKSVLSIILLDIDHFKAINDSHGHQFGDTVLVHCAHIMQLCLRDADIVCRWGGEEFLILLQDCGAGNALRIAEKIRLTIAENPVRKENLHIPVRFSLGVTSFHEGETMDTLLARADTALYRAKSKGRNRAEQSDG